MVTLNLVSAVAIAVCAFRVSVFRQRSRIVRACLLTVHCCSANCITELRRGTSCVAILREQRYNIGTLVAN